MGASAPIYNRIPFVERRGLGRRTQESQELGPFSFCGGNRQLRRNRRFRATAERSERSGESLGVHVTLEPCETAETAETAETPETPPKVREENRERAVAAPRNVTEMSTRTSWLHDINDHVLE